MLTDLPLCLCNWHLHDNRWLARAGCPLIASQGPASVVPMRSRRPVIMQRFEKKAVGIPEEYENIPGNNPTVAKIERSVANNEVGEVRGAGGSPRRLMRTIGSRMSNCLTF